LITNLTSQSKRPKAQKIGKNFPQKYREKLNWFKTWKFVKGKFTLERNWGCLQSLELRNVIGKELN